MGQVWRAWDSESRRRVAMKILAGTLVSSVEFQQRFVSESERHARLNHPNIVRFLDWFTEGAESFLVLELIDGISLKGRLERDRIIPIQEAVSIGADMLSALDYAHQRGVIHRDVKPGNILLDRAGKAYLIDFGIAIAVGEIRLTRTGTYVGTPLYTSPEQILRPRSVDHRTDVYSAGCVLYEMLAGRPPFLPPSEAEDSDFAIKQAHVHDPPIPPRQLNPRIPEPMSALILRSMAKDRDQRLPGCGEFRRQLLESAGRREDREPAREPAVTPVEQRSSRGGRSQAGIIVLMLCTYVAAALAYASYTRKNDRELVIAALLVCQWIVQMFVVYRCWSAIQDGAQSTTPLRAALLLLVPVWNMYWAFRVFAGFASDFNSYTARHKIGVGKIGPVLPALYSICTAAAAIPIVGFIYAVGHPQLGLLWVALSFAMACRMMSAIRALPETPSGIR
jgi:serine/threonine-protein kinase